MKNYTTAEIAKLNGIHANTVRLYEKLQLISEPERKPNGYRIFTQVHLEQMKLVRLTLRGEVLQNGLRKKAITIIKITASGNYDKAIRLTDEYIAQIQNEQTYAEESINIVKQILHNQTTINAPHGFTRKEAAEYLQITIDTLRNWELNGLLTATREKNGYRRYYHNDIQRLKVIRTLRCANYSLSSILRMLHAFSESQSVNIRKTIDTPKEDEDIISVCDRLLTSLSNLKKDAKEMLFQLELLKNKI